ncbi:MAG: hypothetical protein GY750_15940 [Lentisphaerae bacterium]|nr:hypothetical protein [Lentisphaerota bacterium]
MKRFITTNFLFIFFEFALTLMVTSYNFFIYNKNTYLYIVPMIVALELFRNLLIWLTAGDWVKLFVKGYYLCSTGIGFFYAILFRSYYNFVTLNRILIIAAIGYYMFSLFWSFSEKCLPKNTSFENLKIIKKLNLDKVNYNALMLIVIFTGITGWFIMYIIYFKTGCFPLFSKNPAITRYECFNGPYTNGLIRFIFRGAIVANTMNMLYSIYLLIKCKTNRWTKLLLSVNLFIASWAILIAGLRGELLLMFMFCIAIIIAEKLQTKTVLKGGYIISMISVLLVFSTIMRQSPFIKAILNEILIGNKQQQISSEHYYKINKEKTKSKIYCSPFIKAILNEILIGNKQQQISSEHYYKIDKEKTKSKIYYKVLKNKKNRNRLFHIASSFFYMLTPEIFENSLLMENFYKKGQPWLYGLSYVSDLTQLLPSYVNKLRYHYDFGRWTLKIMNITNKNTSCGGIRSGAINRSYFNFGFYGAIIVAFYGVLCGVLFKSKAAKELGVLNIAFLALFFQSILYMGETLLIYLYAYIFCAISALVLSFLSKKGKTHTNVFEKI